MKREGTKDGLEGLGEMKLSLGLIGERKAGKILMMIGRETALFHFGLLKFCLQQITWLK